MKHHDPHTLDLFAPQDAALPLTAQLHAWQQEGLLRQLDVAWMQFVQAHDAHAPDCVLLASALLAHMEGRGHSCLPLPELVQAPHALLAWDSGTHDALTAQWRQLPARLDGWLHALQRCPLVRVASAKHTAPTPPSSTPYGESMK